LGPVLDGGRRSAEVDRSRAFLSQRIHEYRQAVLSAFQDVEGLLTQEERQRLVLQNLDRRIELSDQTVDRVQDRYLNGSVDFLNVLDALLTHQGLERTRLTAVRERLDLRIGLYRALAGGWDLNGPSLAGVEDGVMVNETENLKVRIK
jgi:outer membrane protein, multidrug efflux system